IVGGSTSGSFTLSFNGASTAPLTLNASALDVANAINALSTVKALARSEVQTVTLAGSTIGTFRLTFNSQTTSALAFNATALQVQNALNALSSMKAVGGVVTVTRTANVLTITFGGMLTKTNVGQIIATGAGGTTAVVFTPQEGDDSHVTTSRA